MERGGSSKVARHYLPVVIGMAALAALVVVAPTREPVAQVAGAGSVSGPTYPSGEAPGTPGTTVDGTTCAAGVRQVPWSRYAPICQPAFTGSNGGATSPGVTGSTITLVYRYAATPQEVQLLNSVAPGVFGTYDQAKQTYQDYVALFNKTFELWGRHVVLQQFQGQGDVLQESQGSDVQQAVADAATAHTLGAFADVSGIFDTQPYADGLAAQHIISVDAPLAPGSAALMKAHSPYEYSPAMDCEKVSELTADTVQRALAGLPAINAGDPALRTQTRRFGLISPDNPEYAPCGQATVNYLKQRGIKLATWVHYNLNIQTGKSEAANMIAQLKSAGVTTVLCGCDPLTPLYLAQDATQQNFRPEWMSLGYGDQFARIVPADQWSHDIEGGVAATSPAQLESLQAFHTLYPGVTPPSPTYDAIYEELLLVFDALQAAGPDLNPQTFAAGLDSLPSSLPGGEYGPWTFGPGTVDPPSGFQLLWWNPTGISPNDGKPGTYQACYGGEFFNLADKAGGIPMHQQPPCFGR